MFEDTRERVVESRYYYLLTRYYDPSIGRFISPDSVDYLDPTSINGLNLYAYCNNNPINYVDHDGHSAILAAILIFTGIIVGSVTLGNHAYDQYEKNGWIDKKEDCSVEIHNLWWISNPISRLTFMYRMLRSDEYGSITKKRSLVSLMIEWYLHNFATDISIAMQIITMSVNILTSNGMFWVIPNEIRKYSDDVYFDNDDWWEDLFKWFKKEN